MSLKFRQFLSVVFRSRTIYYGPHPCAMCRKPICRAALEQGGLAYDYPDTPIYPNTRWRIHECPHSEEL